MKVWRQRPAHPLDDAVVGLLRPAPSGGGWRITTSAPKVADRAGALLRDAGVSVDVVIDGPSSTRQLVVLDGPGGRPAPQIEVYFRLAEEPDLGVFKYQTGSWSMVQDLVRDQTVEALEEIDGPALASLKIEEVSFVAKNGPRAGQTITYKKPVLTVKGAAA